MRSLLTFTKLTVDKILSTTAVWVSNPGITSSVIADSGMFFVAVDSGDGVHVVARVGQDHTLVELAGFVGDFSGAVTLNMDDKDIEKIWLWIR